MELDSTTIEVISLVAVIAVASLVDFKLFGRGERQPSFGEAAWWSLGWIGLAAVAAAVLWLVESGDTAVLFTTVYLIERSLSIDNVFVFLLLFSYFSVAPEHRPKLIIIGILFALGLRGLAIVGGIGLLEQFEFLIYVLAAGLLVLAVRVGRGMDEGINIERNLMIRGAQKVFPVTTSEHRGKWFLRQDGKLSTTPIFLCFVGLVFTDIVFAIDSIPAAFAITRDSFIIWSANVFALLGLRALIVLVDRLIDKFKYLDQAIATVLAVIAVKLIVEEAGLVKIEPLTSLGIVAAIFAAGIGLSLIGEQPEDTDGTDGAEDVEGGEPAAAASRGDG